ncbi:MAG: tetratricopeptide repeat protein [Nitrospira sp.]|nr:tetratricopeptide repeat protein [Nitrospira sp.]
MNIVKAVRSALQHYESGDLQQTRYLCEKILKRQPNNVEILHFLGIIYAELKNYDSAIYYLQRSLKLNPINANGMLALGMSFQHKGSLDDAITYYKKTIEIKPDYADAYENLGLALKEKGLLDESIIAYQKAIQINPALVESYNNLGNALREKGLLNEAISYYQTALQIDPSNTAAYNNLGNAFQIKGRSDIAETYYRRAVQLNPDDVSSYQSLLFVMNYNFLSDPKIIFSEHLQFAKRFETPLLSSISPHKNDKTIHRRLKIGYISPDFKRHSVAYFIEPVLAAHKRERFDVFCYSVGSVEDEVTKRLQRYADHWHNITAISDEKAAELIRTNGIDILVDLAGHTTKNRILLFARKPAPVQVSWIGYPVTTGLSAIDYKVVDNYTDPPGMTEEFYTEKLIHMPGSFLCYLPDRDSPEVGPLPNMESGYVTFGSFNTLAKISAEVIDLWSSILRIVQNSRLVMKTFSFAHKDTCEYIFSLFTQKGVAAERIELLLWQPDTRAHLETYNRIDIGLDTFPYNGTTTTCEALWMGVPVITLAGNTHASRVGMSLLSNVGLPELVAGTPDEYVKIAVDLARDLNRLQSLRERLRDMMADSPLTDSKHFINILENSYSEMWQKWSTSA